MTHREIEHFYLFDDGDEDDTCPKCGEETINGRCRDCAYPES